MQFINIRIQPYLVRYMCKKYEVIDGAVLLPKFTLGWYAVMNSAQPRLPHQTPVSGNMTIAVADRAIGKNLTYCNYISEQRMRYIQKQMMLMFDMDLFEYMERLHNRSGINYEDAAYKFFELYELEGYIKEEALLKKHIRWKHLRRSYRKKTAVQREIMFN